MKIKLLLLGSVISIIFGIVNNHDLYTPLNFIVAGFCIGVAAGLKYFK